MNMRAAMALVVAVLGFSACTSRVAKIIPEQIQGHWVTETPGYEDRYLQLERDFVLIGVGRDETPSIQRVYRVERSGNGRQVTYQVYSTGAESDYTLTVYFDPANGGEIRLKNQGATVWRRIAAPSQP